MNVLLAEANIPTRRRRDGEINPEMPQTDVALVLGANDVVNPAADTRKTRPSTGCRSSMPIRQN